MLKQEKNRNVLRNFILYLTHCSHPEDGDDPEFKTPQTYTPEIMYGAVDNYIAEDHVDGYDGEDQDDVYRSSLTCNECASEPDFCECTEKLKSELRWYKEFANHISVNRSNAYNYACEYADDITGVVQYPYVEGDDYWTLQEPAELEYDDNTGCYSNGIVAIQSCWDDQSKDFHRENPDREYFNSLEEVLQRAKHQYDFIKIECFDSDMEDIDDGDYFVATDDDYSKYQKSY